MGYWKNKQIAIDERGYGEINTIVCNSCFGDYALKKYIKSYGERSKCDYCGMHRKSMRLEEVLGFILECIKYEYEDANGCMGWNGREGGFQGAHTWVTYDFIHEALNYEMEVENSKLLDHIIETMNDITWCEYDPYNLRSYDENIHEWKEYAFKAEKSQQPDADILDTICQYIKTNKLIKTHSKKISYFRGVVHNTDEDVNTAKRIGSAPSKFSATNRMSSANESVFYGADDIETCVKEISNNNNKIELITLAKFYPSHKLKILDLTRLGINIPSLFDEGNRDKRNSSMFLRIFSGEISKPVEPNEINKYIPTQKLAHYLKNEFKLDGIAYESSKNQGHKCYVLFFENKDCSDNVGVRGHKLCMDQSTIIQKKY